MLFSAPPASAAGKFCVQTTDARKGGEACFIPTGDILRACDLEADSHRVRVEMTYAGGSFSFQVLDGQGSCHEGVKNLTEGTAVTVKVCLKNGSAGREVHCASESGFA